MTNEEIEREIADLERYIKWKQDDIDKLLAQYKGVRPSWVSGDIGWDMMQIDDARNSIKELKEQLKEQAQ